MALRVSSAVLNLDVATQEFRASKKALRDLLLAVEELRLESELLQIGLPDISAPLATLAKMQRYDACKALIAAFEDFVEAQVNVNLANQRIDYEKVVETPSDPEYLRASGT